MLTPREYFIALAAFVAVFNLIIWLLERPR